MSNSASRVMGQALESLNRSVKRVTESIANVITVGFVDRIDKGVAAGAHVDQRSGNELDRAGHDTSERAAASPVDPRSVDGRGDRGAERGELSAQIESRYGIPVARQQEFQDYADRHDLMIYVRPTNPDSVRWIERGSPGKPELIKAKTISSVDVELGAPADRQGLVGYFRFPGAGQGELRLPERGTIPEERWNQLRARLDQRVQEYEALRPTMEAHIAASRFEVRDGVVYGRNAEGEFRPLTGDHDLFDIRHADGRRLTPEENFLHFDQAHLRDMGVEHPPLANWNPTTPRDWEEYLKLMDQHGAGGEPLVRFEPGQQPTLAHMTAIERAEIADDRAVLLREALRDTEDRLDHLRSESAEHREVTRELELQAEEIRQMIDRNQGEAASIRNEDAAARPGEP